MRIIGGSAATVVTDALMLLAVTQVVELHDLSRLDAAQVLDELPARAALAGLAQRLAVDRP